MARDEQVVSPSYTRLYPLVVERGSGSTIEDVDGNLFLDFTAGIAVTSTGHCHPEVVAAIVDQAQQLIHMSGTDFYYSPEIELAERLARLAPGPALEARLLHQQRRRGDRSGVEAGALSHRAAASDRVLRQRFTAAPTARCRSAGRRRFINAASARWCRACIACRSIARARSSKNLFATVVPPDEVAAIFVEPIQGEGGYRVPSPDFLPMLRDVCDRARHSAGGRRNAVGHGPHGQDVRLRAFRRRRCPTCSAWPRESPAECRWGR